MITGVGVVSPFGLGWPRFQAALRAGEHGIRAISSFDATGSSVQVAGEVPLGGMSVGRDRKLTFGVLAAVEAWQMAGCGDAEKCAALSFGLGLEQALLEDFEPVFHAGSIQWARTHAQRDGLALRVPLDHTTRAIRERLGLTGREIVHASACATGTMAVAQAAAWIRRGEAQIVVCGAADSMVNPMGIGGMARLGAPGSRAGPDACRPFDVSRDGLALGEGAAAFIVENAAHAQARGAQPLAEVAGWATTQDAHALTSPRPDGSRALAAMAGALRRAGITPADLDYINAHGTGTPLNDVTEARAIRALLGTHSVPVSSIKGAIGHLMAAAGAVELAACIFALQAQIIPGTAHLNHVDPECPIDVVGPMPRPAKVHCTLSNSFGFGGQNSTIVLRR